MQATRLIPGLKVAGFLASEICGLSGDDFPLWADMLDMPGGLE